ANVDSFDSRDGDNVARFGLFDGNLLQTFVGVELRDLGLFQLAVNFADEDLIADGDLAIEDAANRQSSHVFAVIQIGDQNLHRQILVADWRWNGLQYLIKQRAQIRAF